MGVGAWRIAACKSSSSSLFSNSEALDDLSELSPRLGSPRVEVPRVEMGLTRLALWKFKLKSKTILLRLEALSSKIYYININIISEKVNRTNA